MIRKLLLIITVIILISDHSLSQVNYDKNFLDSIFTEYVNLKEVLRNKDYNKPLGVKTEKSKCGLFLINFVKQNIDLFTPQQQQVLKKLAGRPDTTQSIVSPFGKFRIHYYVNDLQKPKYFPSMSIEENLSMIAMAIDSVYNFEVNYLGYPPPPSDNGAGGDNLYDIYIVNLGGGLYGYTESEGDLGGQKYTSFMVIDNDYVGYYSSGINGAKVTLAHEFHHGIQMGNYILRFEDTFFYEITSTSMEEFVYDDVNDYYAYMPSYFFNPQKAFAENDGYNLAIWNVYLKETFGFSIIKRQWELMPSQRAMNAISTSITEAGSSFKHELNRFGAWTYYTKHRAIPGKYFKEASFYPLIRPLSTLTFTSPDEVVPIYSKATANNFIHFTNQINNDTLFVLITNGDVVSAGTNISQLFPCTLYLYDNNVNGAIQLTEKYYAKLETEKPSLWLLFGEAQGNSVNYPFPQPFSYAENYQQGPIIIIPVMPYDNGNVDFYVYSSSMNLIYSEENYQPALSRIIGGYSINWKVLDNQKRKLASGVYIYVVKSGDKIEKGKLVILHD